MLKAIVHPCSRTSTVCRAQVQEQRARRPGREHHRRSETDWIQHAPQVRVRVADDRAKDQLGELAVLNARLAGQEAWQIRKRVEYLKRKRKAWENVYYKACTHETALTLESLESAIEEVEAALEDGRDEFQSISDAKAELIALQNEVQDAHKRLHATEERVEQNVQRLTELKAEAARIARVNEMSARKVTVASTSANAATVEARQTHERSDAAASNSAPAIPTARPSRQRVSKRSRGLASSLALEPGLRNFWYAVAFSSKLKPDTLTPIELFGESWVLFRDADGAAACVYDECAHRACPLSLGTVDNGQVQCPYHGWTFNAQGECTRMPSTVQCAGIRVAHLPTEERDGFIWVWAGDEEPVAVPDNTLPPSGFVLHSEIEVEVPVEHGLLMENLLDLAHAPFTHTSTFARGWPVPDAVRFHTQRMLAGHWDPYPIDMSFEPPCMVLSMIGLKQPGAIETGARAGDCKNHLHQLHVCLPSRKGHTRLLYRMSLDFMPWIRHVPGIQRFWEYIAGQVLGEDLVLVQGQQRRMQRGGDTWNNPVSYDKLAVRYRRWRNDVGDAHAAGLPTPAAAYRRHTMSAGQLFEADDDGDKCVYVDRSAEDDAICLLEEATAARQ